MKTLILKNIVKGTSTNSDASSLCSEMQNYLVNDNDTVALSFADIEYVSSSFLNSSIGEIIDKIGYSSFAKRVKFLDCKPDIATLIKDYIFKYKSLVAH